MIARFPFLVALAVCALGTLLPPWVEAASGRINVRALEELRATNEYTHGRPRHVTLTWEGDTILFLRSGPRDAVLHLYEQDVATGVERAILAPAALETTAQGARRTNTIADQIRRERLRNTSEGITEFELFDDEERLLIPHGGRLFLVERATGAVVRLPGEDWIDPQFSPDERFLAAVRDRELHVIDLETHAVRQLTHGASDTVSHGLAEFTAMEEMDRYSGFWWSPDGTMLACQETDESGVELFTIADPKRPKRGPRSQRYPRAGTPPAQVRLHLVPVDGGTRVAVRWDAERFPYLARVQWWRADAPLTLLVQNRRQTEQLLLTVDPATGDTTTLLRETDQAWLNLDEYNEFPRWLPGATQFAWTTEHRGGWQLEVRHRDGKLARVVTPVGFGYAGLLSAHEAGGFLVRGTTDPGELHVWRFPRPGGRGAQLTNTPGLHRYQGIVRQGRRLHLTDTPEGERLVRVINGSGEVLATVASRALAPARPPQLELTRTTGEFPCDAALIRPHDFVPGRKYPVLLNVYGGPAYKMVTADGAEHQEAQVYANHGYIVVKIDGRGTPGRGRAWERALQGNLIDVVLTDQIAALQELGARHAELDLTRVGIWGSSYGGYVSAMATIRRPDIFRCGVAIAPVINWEDYDAHYTERYLGLPQDEPEAYRRSNVTTYAAELTRPLLLAHGIWDDNVHFQHSVNLVAALKAVGKSCELVRLPGTHVHDSPEARHKLDRRMLEFFARHVQGKAPAAPP